MTFLQVPVITPLQVSNSSSAETVRQVIDTIKNIPMLDVVREVGEEDFIASTTDAASSNIKYEDIMNDLDMEALRVHLLCLGAWSSRISGKLIKL